MKLPSARNENIIVQNLNKELLVYNLSTNRAYNLNETSAIVYNACGSGQTFGDLQSAHEYTDEIILLALDELRKNDLLADSTVSPLSGVSRREVVRRAGLATMIALPVISALVAPTAAHAQSGFAGLGADCTTATCAPGLTCTNQFGTGTICRATPGGNCDFGRPDLCTTGCCQNTAGGPVCCQF